jgi:hypothetical protein
MSVLLLVLLAHAFIVSATHMHRLEQAGGAHPGQSRSAGNSEDAARSGETGNHAQCLLCRLQRNFISEFSDSSLIAPAPQSGKLSYHGAPAVTVPVASFLCARGRAPPSA